MTSNYFRPKPQHNVFLEQCSATYTCSMWVDSVKGQSFHVIEEFDRFIALDINGVVCDFAKSEVEIFEDWGLFDPKCKKMN